MQAFWLAVQFLTRLPTPLQTDIPPLEVGRSLAWYPLVGLLLGAILWGVAFLLQGQDALLSAAIILTLWVLLTGALHLDGLADCADAWVGGLGDRERTLAIMKDPFCGPIAVTTLVVMLLLKFTALSVLLPETGPGPLLVIPSLARSGVALLFATTPYVRAAGLGEALAQYAPRSAIFVGALAVLVLLFLGFGNGAWLVLVVALLVWAWLRHAVLKRLGGFTGDVAGALLESLECATLLVFALSVPIFETSHH